MDSLELIIVNQDYQDRAPGKGLVIKINGHKLIDLVRPVELVFATMEGHPNKAGNYGWLHPMNCELFFTEDELADAGRLSDDPFKLLGSSCGEDDSWPLMAHMDMKPTTVRWHSFFNPYRTTKHLENFRPEPGDRRKFVPWHYEALGPFVFDRQQFDAAFLAIASDVEAERARLKAVQEKAAIEWSARYDEIVAKYGEGPENPHAV